MPPNSEIDKLERRWKENPKGTVFAPYAEVLRKHGNLELARDILRQGLEIHPDHIPGNIVLGRCCLDLGEEGPAEAAFTHVLDLDPENVIALKALGDITERQGRLLEAAGWLQRLMTVDPSNDEAREQFARVSAARESASSTMTTSTAVPGRAGAERTETHFVIQPPTPASLELPVAEVGHGVIGEERPPVEEQDTDDVVEAVLSQFEAPPPPLPPRPPSLTEALRPSSETTVPVMPAFRPPLPDLEPAEVDLTAIPDTPALEGIEPDQVFEPPPPEMETARADIGLEETLEDLQLRSSGGSEFQTPDASEELERLEPGPTEYQQPDASADLRASRAREYQVPDVAAELAGQFEDLDLTEPSLEPGQPPAVDDLSSVTTGFAAISAMPTEEWSADGAPPGHADESGEEPGADLRLIFPEQASQPEPHRPRRISEEIASARRAAEPTVDPPVGEPALVFTESMAELYAQQGHVAEALNVYRVLLTRTPNDPRLAERVRELEADLTSGNRRLSYVAVETGGESVESFFRALAQARPAGEATEPGGEPGGAAPTRPARDPLSLSSIFGEEGATGQAPAARPDTRAPDPFSFDQFFGGSEGPPHNTGPRQAMPPDEDLDQFQNWLKSLRR